jgi:Protein of unknown function (DUF2510)
MRRIVRVAWIAVKAPKGRFGASLCAGLGNGGEMDIVEPADPDTKRDRPLTQPGWYADPSGGDGHRWWDGTRWTAHVNPPPQRYGTGQPAGPGDGPVLHKTRYGVELYADANSITWDGTTIELAKAEFVGYTVVQNRMRGPLNIGSVHTSTDYHFEIGFFPVNQAPAIAFEETGLRAKTSPSDPTDLRHIETLTPAPPRAA